MPDNVTVMTEFLSHQIKTPWQPMSVIIDASGKPTVVAAAFSSLPDLIAKAGGEIAVSKIRKDPQLLGVVDVVNNWIDGDVNAFDSLTVRQPGGEFMQECWKALRKVRGGTVVSYADLALKAGRPRAMRAAGTACASNLIAPIIPCHRVVRTGGDLGNYGFGVPLKRTLLEHEGITF